MLDKRFSVEHARKLLGEIDLEDGVAPGHRQSSQCWKSLLQFFHLHLCDIDLRNKIAQKVFFFLEQSLLLFFLLCYLIRFR